MSTIGICRFLLRLKTAALVLWLAAPAIALAAAGPSGAKSAEPVTVAFIGDQGEGAGTRAVLEMIKAQGADMVLDQGDFDYYDDPDAWDALISKILGADFPYFASVGNHDVDRWGGADGYQAKLQARLWRIAGAQCDGDLGVMSACTFRGLFFILSGIGTLPDEQPDAPRHLAFIQDQLAHTHARWRICSWHKDQGAMQVSSAHGEVGWLPYELCRLEGAIVATGHSHTYSRTFLMAGFREQRIASTSDVLVIKKGQSFAFVSGLGGKSIKPQKHHGRWWASVYTKDQDADYGALFCTFNAGGDANRAECYFRDIRGRVVDRFKIINAIGDGEPRRLHASR